MNTVQKNSFSFYYYIYYGVLLFFVSYFQNFDYHFGIVSRMAFLCASIIPCFLKDINWAAPCITLFYIVSSSGIGSSIMPSDMYIYAIVSVLFFIFSKYKHLSQNKTPVIWVLLLLWMLFVDVSTSFRIEDSFYCMIFLMLIGMSTDYSQICKQPIFRYSFIFATLALSILILMNKEMLFISMNYHGDMQRVKINHLNYSSMTMAIGTIFSVLCFLRKDEKLFFKVASIVTFSVSIIAMSFLGSRGAVLDIIVALIFVVLVHDIKKKYKVLIILAFILGTVYLYQKGYLDILIYRMENDATGDGSGRGEIWDRKLSAFFSGDILNQIIGYGFDGGHYLGGEFRFCHNDFIAFLVEYGYVGLILFVSFLLYPIRVAFKNDRKYLSEVIILMMFLVTACFTLEPISNAQLSFFLLYFFISAFAYGDKQYEHKTM